MKMIWQTAAVIGIGAIVTMYRLWLMPVPEGFKEIQIQPHNTESQPIARSAVPVSPKTVSSTPSQSKIWIHIAGQVPFPGLYAVTPNQRVKDVLPLAGGLLPDANLDKVNLVQRIKDGQKITIPKSPTAKTKTQTPSLSGPVSLNTATATQLTGIPGIGPATAKRILDYRAKNGPFTSIESLTNIKGIGPKSLQKIKPFISI